MPQMLFDVSFNSNKEIGVYNASGKKTGTKLLSTPISLSGLTLEQAQSYSGNPGYSRGPHTAKPKKKSSHSGIGTATKSVDWSLQRNAKEPSKKVAKPALKSSTHNAARTGDMAAAIND